jgi:hypothetical protein
MTDQIKEIVVKLHNRHISEFITQIRALFHGSVNVADGDNKALPDDKNASNFIIDRDAGHDKETGFRNNLRTTPNSNQPELAKLINDRTSEFERELRKIPSLTEIKVRSELQRFKEELMATIYSGVQ